MDTRNNSVKMTKRKIIGLISLIVFSLVFIFSCFKKILPIGAWLVGTFGSLVYPMSIVFAFISLAIFLGFSYSKSIKPVAFFAITLFAVIFAIHSIKTYKALDCVVTFSNVKAYLNLSYQKTTLVGSFGSILCAILSIMLGAMGTIVTYVILATIFAGLFLDYEIYGKYHETHIKKLKTRKMREKVSASDRDLRTDGSPNYSFEQNSKVEVADEISVDAIEYETTVNNYSSSVSNYSNSEVVDEITTSQYNENNGFDSSYSTNYQDNESQTLNTFSNDIYKQESVPDVYSPDMDNFRRQFMNATFGTTAATASDIDREEVEQKSTEFGSLPNFEEDTNSSNSGFASSLTNDEDDEDNSSFLYSPTISDNTFGGLNDFTENDYKTPSFDDDFSKILNSSDDDIENEVKNDISGISFDSNFDNRTSQDFGFGSQRNFSNAEQQTPKREVPKYGEFEPAGRYGAGFNTADFEDRTIQNNTVQPVTGFDNRNFGSGVSNPFASQNVVIPKKEIKTNQFVSKMGMPGVRYNAPTLSLLKTPVPDTGDYTAEQNRKTALLENALSAFKIPAKVKNIVRGPKITRYELSVPLGVSVKKIPMYEDDIAAALAAKTITIKAPIPGSSFVGIELENDTFTTVYQRELFESEAFQNCKDPLPIAIGKDISGEIIVKSLVDMVHLLIAGSTGSGKSVFIHNVVLSLIYKSSPDDLRLIMVDPKKVEFPVYNGLPHLLTPEVVAGSQKAINALKWCVKEMDRRYDLMAKAGFNNIKPYNKSELVKAGQFEKLPYIVIVVDELAEIMQANKKEAEGCIQRITQLARACGMHMVLATQRPSVDIITGVIKNNIPSRIAFSLQSGIDSKTIINTVGAEKLLGRGDMIFAPTGTSAMPRLQASYASDEEIKAVIEYTIKNNEASYDESVEKAMDQEQSDGETSVSFNGGDGLPPQKDTLDSYFKVAVKIVMQNGGASTSYLQRRLSIGYSRAAKIMDQMSDKGYIAPANGSKQRKILITPEQFREDFGEDFDSMD